MEKFFKILATVFFVIILAFLLFVLLISNLEAFSVLLILISSFFCVMIYGSIREEIEEAFNKK